MINATHAILQPLINQYGSFALFGLLAFGIIGLPIPDETLLLICGFLAAKGKLPLSSVLSAAILGSCCGISVSYFIGRFLGIKAVPKFGKYVGINQAKMEKAHDWFAHFGKYLLLIGYFIPGIRHFTGLTAGTAKLEYPSFAIFAYIGAIIWSLVFVLTGYFFGNHWQSSI